MICCADCQGFIKDSVGDGMGIGECKAYNFFVAKGYSKSDLNIELVRLGNKENDPVFWGGNLKDRMCNRFKPIPA